MRSSSAASRQKSWRCNTACSEAGGSAKVRQRKEAHRLRSGYVASGAFVCAEKPAFSCPVLAYADRLLYSYDVMCWFSTHSAQIILVLGNFLFNSQSLVAEMQAVTKCFGKLLFGNMKKIFPKRKLFCVFACRNFTFFIPLQRFSD